MHCPSCNSSIVVQVEEEPLPSASKLKQSPEVTELNLTDDENSNDSTPINSRCSKKIYWY